MITYLTRLTGERDSLTQSATELTERAARDDRDLTDTERTSMTSWQTRCAEIDAQLTEYGAQAESQRAYAQLRTRLAQPSDDEPVTQRRAATAPLSAGQMFVDSAEFRGYNGRGQSGVIEVADYVPTNERAVVTTADLAIPNFVLPPRVQEINIPPLLTIVDVVSVSAGVVEWVTITGDPQAAVVAEGAAKPEAVLTYTPTSAPLDTLAHWVQITRQALDDASYIRSVVEGKLRRGLTLAIADAIQDAITAATLPTSTGTSLLGAIRAGIGTVQSNGYMPNAVVLNPADWADLDMTVMGGTLGGPVIGQTFWGLTVVPSRFQAAGTALVGDFKAGVAWFDRNVSSVFISDSHADLFIKNTLVILAETRGKAAVPEPNALCEAAATVVPLAASAPKS